MTVDVESLAEEVRKIAGRPTIGQLARGFLRTAADGLEQLEAENARLRDFWINIEPKLYGRK